MLLLEDMATKIKDALNLHIEFGYDLDDGDKDYALDILRDNLADFGLEKECLVDCGVSKMVIIPERASYVIKTPLFGSVFYPEEYNEEEEEYYYNYDNPQFEFYEGAWFEDADIDCSNYCELEEHIYNIAVECGVADMLAKTEFFGYAKHNRPLYLSEKCRPFSWSRKASESSSSIVKEKRKSNTPGWSRMDSQITALFIDDYGIKRASQLFEFLSTYHINDLHSGNVMFSEKTGKIVISDYSGFCN